MVSVPLISLGKYSSQIEGVHHMHEKSEHGRHLRHRKETRGLSGGSDRVAMRKIPRMLKKHSFSGSQEEKEGNLYTNTHTHKHEVTHLSKSKQRLSDSPFTVQQIKGLKMKYKVIDVTICHTLNEIITTSSKQTRSQQH